MFQVNASIAIIWKARPRLVNLLYRSLIQLKQKRFWQMKNLFNFCTIKRHLLRMTHSVTNLSKVHKHLTYTKRILTLCNAIIAIRFSLSPHFILTSQNILQNIGAKIRKHNEQSYKNDKFQIQK